MTLPAGRILFCNLHTLLCMLGCCRYAQHCHKAIGKSKFVTNKNLTDTQPHVLVSQSYKVLGSATRAGKTASGMLTACLCWDCG